MAPSTEHPAVASPSEAGPQGFDVEDVVRERIRAFGEDEEEASDTVAFSAASMTHLLDDMLAQIDRNLELANGHLARA